MSIINLKKSFDVERGMGPTVFTKDSIGLVARSLDIGRRTVENILADYNKNGQTLIELPPRSRGKPPLRVSGDLVSHIHHHIRSVNMQGDHISVRNLRAWLLQEFSTDIPLMTLNKNHANENTGLLNEVITIIKIITNLNLALDKKG